MIYRRFPKKIRHVLFICKGNICRSPLAAAYVEAKLREKNYRFIVRSAGLETTRGKEAYALAKVVAQQHGLSLKSHVTAPLIREMVEEADLILVMEYSHRRRLLGVYPSVRGKVFQLSQFSHMKSGDIADPYQGTFEKFETCYQIIRQSCDDLLRRIDMGVCNEGIKSRH